MSESLPVQNPEAPRKRSFAQRIGGAALTLSVILGAGMGLKHQDEIDQWIGSGVEFNLSETDPLVASLTGVEHNEFTDHLEVNAVPMTTQTPAYEEEPEGLLSHNAFVQSLIGR